MARSDVPLCLKRAGDEVLKALGSRNATDEGAHRRRAEHYFAQAIEVIELEPERTYDWSELRSRG